jgi:sugar phosphate isomerase/epimerase
VTAGLAAPKLFRRLFEPYRRTLAAVELYGLMEKDAQLWARAWKLERYKGLSAVEFLAELDPTQAGDISRTLRSRYAREGVSLTGIASFIPEVACAPGSDGRNNAIRAIATLVRMAQGLVPEDCVPVVEVVAGSRVEAVKINAGEVVANKVPDETGRTRVLSAIRLALRIVLGDDPAPRVAIGIELEPGPLFLLHDESTLRAFAVAIAKDEVLRPYVGFNLDIVHWRLADIRPEIITPNHRYYEEAIAERIIHAHVGGHHPNGHFGDVRLLEINELEDFLPWVRALRKLASLQRGPTLPQFSGCVSVEFEAARSEELVVNSVDDLATLLETP